MTQPIQEPTLSRTDSRLSWGQNQLFRRPSLNSAGRFVGIIFSSVEAVVVGNDAGGWFLVIPADLNNSSLIEAQAAVYTTGTGTTVQVRNVTGAVDMLSTAITIDSGENTSYTAATPPVINPANADVSTGDIIVVDADVAGGAEGLDIILAFG